MSWHSDDHQAARSNVRPKIFDCQSIIFYMFYNVTCKYDIISFRFRTSEVSNFCNITLRDANPFELWIFFHMGNKLFFKLYTRNSKPFLFEEFKKEAIACT